jgi:hypothetical protein
MHWLVGLDGSVRDKTFLIGGRTMTIGRQPSNLIQVVDDDVAQTLQLRPAAMKSAHEQPQRHFLNGVKSPKR